MVTFTPDGKDALVANEGEPNDAYTIDPEGSVSIVHVGKRPQDVRQSDVRTAGFGQFPRAGLDPSIRVYGPGATVAQDLEPEYITLSNNGRTAWVSIQEANALGVLDVKRGVFTALHGLGFKDWTLPANQLDPSDRDNAIKIANWPVLGMYQPDGIAAYHTQGEDYVVSANEGDARAYSRLQRGEAGQRGHARPGRVPERGDAPGEREPRPASHHERERRRQRGRALRAALRVRGAVVLDLERRRGARLGLRRRARADHRRRAPRPVQLEPRDERLVRHPQRRQGPGARGRRGRQDQGPLVRVRRARADRRRRRVRHQRPARAAVRRVREQPQLRRRRGRRDGGRSRSRRASTSCRPRTVRPAGRCSWSATRSAARRRCTRSPSASETRGRAAPLDVRRRCA